MAIYAAKTMSIQSETDRLHRAALWGRPSTEAVLAQLYPKDVSLFMGHMDVAKAGQETAAFADLLRQKGVDVMIVRDLLAQQLPVRDVTKDQVVYQLFDKAATITERYGLNGSSSVNVQEMIVHTLEQDIAQYGEQKGLALAMALSLDYGMPLGNIIYARDHTNVVLGQRVVASMAEPIRVPEVALYEMVYGNVFKYENSNPIIVPPGEKFEGGDLYAHRDGSGEVTVYIGVGARTTLGAALHIVRKLSDHNHRVKFAIVKNGSSGTTFHEVQESMHIDTFSMPIGENQFVVCEEEASKRHVFLVEISSKGATKVKTTGKTFIEYLEGKEYDLTKVTKEEQTFFGCNILMLNEDTASIPVAPHANIVSQLRDKGKKIELVDLQAVTNGFGATHCLVAPFRRS